MSSPARKIALVGNPNCGKTTLFNALTGLRQKVGNYPGVTVEKKIGELRSLHGEKIELLDLPGTYSLSARSDDERVARDVLLGDLKGTDRPDAVLCVVDASNLERNLYLVLQVIDLKLPVIIALNMIDVLEEKGQRIDPDALSQQLGGTPVIPCQANQEIGIVDIKAALSRPPHRAHRRWNAGDDVERILEKSAEILISRNHPNAAAHALTIISDRAMRDRNHPHCIDHALLGELESIIQSEAKSSDLPIESRIVAARYETIGQISAAAVRGGDAPMELSFSDNLDATLIHPIKGWLIFIAVMVTMFYSMFTLASVPMDWIDGGFGALGEFVGNRLVDGDLKDLIVNGIIGGVGGVVIFLPQILILFFFIGVLESSGYMARAAFIMDRLMSKVGLNGKSFIPLLSSYACAIPGIMGTRTIEDDKDRLVTILVAPLMSCTARLPVYVILIGVMTPNADAVTRTSLMFGLYALGTLGAFFFAWIFKRAFSKNAASPFLIELPPYRMPGWKLVFQQLLDRGLVFLKRAGTIILGLSILIWAASTYPKPADPDTPREIALEQSYMGQAGKIIEPVVKPLGYDWKIGSAIVWSFAAREVFNSAIGIIYKVGDDAENTELENALANAKNPDGSPIFSFWVCAGLLVFYVFAQQCIATFAVVKRETASWKWPIFQVVYMTSFAYFAAMAVYQIGSRFFG